MPKHVTQKAETALRNAKPKEKPYRIGDGGGLYLLVNPDGGKLWRWQYQRPNGKRNTLALGEYPAVTQAKARLLRDDARKLLADGVDPGEHKKAQRIALMGATANSFEVVAREWQAQRTVLPDQRKKSLARMEKDVFPWIGSKPIAEINAPQVLAVMRRIDARGARYTAHKAKEEISMVMRYAIATGRREERDPCPDLKGAIPPARTRHMAAITDPKEVAELIRALDAFKGTFVVASALRMAPLVFVRPGELRKAKWAEFDLEKAEWRYRVSKTNVDHLVPLSRQAVAILRDLHPLTGRRVYVFPGRDPQKPMSDAAINAALRRMGYDTQKEMTGHGFRAMARTILHEELGQKWEAIEHQLSHSVPDALGDAYNRTKFLEERRSMMQIWADYLDKLKTGAKVPPLNRAG